MGTGSCVFYELKVVPVPAPTPSPTPDVIDANCDACSARYGDFACIVPATDANRETCDISANQNMCEGQGGKWCKPDDKFTCGVEENDSTCGWVSGPPAGQCMARLPDGVDCDANAGQIGCRANGKDDNCVYCVYDMEQCKSRYHCENMFLCHPPGTQTNSSVLV